MPIVPLTLASLQGHWTRSLLSWPDGRLDDSSVVTWLQGPTRYADLRQPRSIASVMTAAPPLRALTLAQVLRLTDQEGFAGTLVPHPDASFEWQRQIDFQPHAGRVDRGFLEDVGSMMVETGFADSYTENWHRSDRTNGPCAALALQALGDGCAASIVRVGRTFMVARDRATTLSEGHLRDHVAKAASLEAAQDLVDCEISFGTVTNDGWRIDRSTLPHRVGRLLAPQITRWGLSTADVDPWGRPIVRRWTITAEDGGFAVE
jgi:hypothetical protein